MDMTGNAPPAKRGVRAANPSTGPYSHRYALGGSRPVRALGTSVGGRFDPLEVTPGLPGGTAPGPRVVRSTQRVTPSPTSEGVRPAMVRTIGIAYDLKADMERAAQRAVGEGELPDDAFEEYDSEATVAAIEEALGANGYRTRRLGSGRSFLARAMHDAGDLVFNIAEGYGTRSREAHVPSALEMLGIPYTHSDPLTLALTLDKAMAKRVVASAGVPTPRFAVVESLEGIDDLPLRYPLIAKPLFEGSSMGVRKHSRVTDPDSLRELVVQLLADYHEPVLVEEFAGGPEFTVGVLGTGAGAQVIGAMEIVPKRCDVGEFVYSLEVKRNYLEEVEYAAPPDRPAELVRAVEEVGLAAYRALACRDVGRVDVRLDADGEPKFLEVNPLPGLNPVTGDLVILARANGLHYADLIGRIVEGARERQSL
jgi:D-alanine-D-alanine ligase